MKIDVVGASRGHPQRLQAVLTCFDALATGDNEVTYRIICDEDDPLTAKALSELPFAVGIHQGSGPIIPRYNDAIREGNADIVTTASDDTFPLAQHWDALLCYGIKAGHPLFCWQELNDPSNYTMPVFSKKWLNAVGRCLPEYFPYWFSDVWVSEVYEMVFCRPPPIVENLPWGGKRGKTSGMRELSFWMDFYAATRVERIEEARAVCFAFGLPYNPPEEMFLDMKKRDAEQLARVPFYNETFEADKGEPTQTYLTLKAQAMQWLINHQGIAHGS